MTYVSGFYSNAINELKKASKAAQAENQKSIMDAFNKLFEEIKQLKQGQEELQKENKELRKELDALRKDVAPNSSVIKRGFGNNSNGQ